MIQNFEFVSLFHPDRLCDLVTSSLLDYCIQKDPFVEYKVECVIDDQLFIAYGYININYNLTDDIINSYVTKLFRKLKLPHQFFSTIVITSKKTQSRHIDGSGNYYGLATKNKSFLPDFYFNCNKIAKYLDYQFFRDLYKVYFYKDDDKFDIEVILTNKNIKLEHFNSLIIPYITDIFETSNFKVNLEYKDIKHLLGSTGRKLGIDYYNNLIPNNGGSPWGKDPYNADLTLNLYARSKAIDFIKSYKFDYVLCKLSCFDQNQALIQFFDINNNLILNPKKVDFKPDLIKNLNLNKPIYSDFCKNGLIFSIIK